MAQANAIIVRIRKEQQEEFERLFEEEELPLWDEFVAQGKFLKARLARIEYGTEEREDVVLYLIYAEVPGMAEHGAHDEDPRFLSYLGKARKLQPEPPSVFGATSCSPEGSSRPLGQGRRRLVGLGQWSPRLG